MKLHTKCYRDCDDPHKGCQSLNVLYGLWRYTQSVTGTVTIHTKPADLWKCYMGFEDTHKVLYGLDDLHKACRSLKVLYGLWCTRNSSEGTIHVLLSRVRVHAWHRHDWQIKSKLQILAGVIFERIPVYVLTKTHKSTLLDVQPISPHLILNMKN